MRTIHDPAKSLTAAIDALDSQRVADLPDDELRGQLLDLLTAVHRLHAQVVRRTAAFDTRGLSVADACRSTKSWLRAFGRMSSTAAGCYVKAARLLRLLPTLAAAARAGQASAEHVARVSQLADRVGIDNVRGIDGILTEAAGTLDPADLQRVCDRVRAHMDPDGAQPDPHEDYERRGITLSPFDGMVLVRGQLDPDGGAALLTALEAVTPPPAEGDDRTPAQRRADALVELARAAPLAGTTPRVAGVRAQVGILLTPDVLTRPTHTRNGKGRHSMVRLADAADGHERGQPRGDPVTAAGIPPAPDTAWLEWIGEIPDSVAQRLACDADLWRIILDPATGLPLDVGRSHRLVPHWIRKALWARDRGCRFPGCRTPAAWTDAHHYRTPWTLGGNTDIDNLILVCRHHHVLLHEGGWTIDLDRSTGTVAATRPDGRPYEIPPSHPWTGPTTRAA